MSFFGLVVVVCAPLVWLSWDWAPMLWFVIASALMLLRRGPALCVVATTLLGLAAAQFLSLAPYYPDANAAAIPITVFMVYATTATAVGGIGMYGAARLVFVLDELVATRAELAELAVGRERLRVSRDLHDLLGQSLSAIALKGDVAIRLLRTDPSAARAEVASLAGVAREALRGMRAITRAEPAISLAQEIGGAAALLRAAGIQPHIDVHLDATPAAVEEVLAWAVREAITNVLRHAEARMCSITAYRDGSQVRLEIVNDGVPPLTGGSTGDGSGLAGLADRARAQAGHVATENGGDGRFRLLVELAVAGG